MSQIGRNLTDAMDGFFAGKRYLIHDRDPPYTKRFLSILAAAGTESLKLPPRSPILNAYAERFIRTIKEGCLEQMIFFGEDLTCSGGTTAIWSRYASGATRVAPEIVAT